MKAKGLVGGLVTTVVAVVLAGCGSGGGTGGTPTTPTVTPSPHATPSATPTPAAATYPAHDTPVAEAPAAMRLAWEGLGIQKLIPGADVFSKAPAMPAVQNHTTESAAAVQALETAFWRTETLIQWAEAHDEIAFATQTLIGRSSQTFFLPDAVSAMTAEEPVLDPNCDIFGTAVATWPQSSAVQTWIESAGFPAAVAASPSVVVAPFNEAGCNITIVKPGGNSTEPADPTHATGVDTVVFVGEVVNDPTVGAYFHLEASTNCDHAGADPQIC